MNDIEIDYETMREILVSERNSLYRENLEMRDEKTESRLQMLTREIVILTDYIHQNKFGETA
ncbi:MAG: hypothetical protein M1165_02610 [Candidatus Pacearchaeota archaeon]|nr:hypothetical protein [Candidatus Pacearchaeota archaeon]MDE1848601.1 hypothetical protein [Nanoarchaeota archaeon]